MASAVILSLEEFRDTQRRAAIRQRLHARLNYWLNTLEARETRARSHRARHRRRGVPEGDPALVA